MKAFGFLSFLLLFLSSSFAGEFKKVEISKGDISKYNLEGASLYTYTGVIAKEDTGALKKIIDKEKGQMVFVIITSIGGDFFTGLELGEITKENKVYIIVDQAYSSAGFWAMADPGRTFLDDKESVLGIHLPYKKTEETTEDSMMVGALLFMYLMDICGVSKEKAIDLMFLMREAKIKHGIGGVVSLKKDSQEIVKIK